MLSSGMSGASRTSLLGPLDPLLRDFESEYQYLFKCVYEAAHISEERSIAEYYGLPNIARRLLESFLMFKIPNQAGRLYRKLESVSFDPAKKARIYRFINTYSHFDQIGEPVHDASVLIETPAILNDILAMMRYLDAGHCESMVELIAANDEVGKGVGA
jgi:wobble nucleotide-excising tRNase